MNSSSALNLSKQQNLLFKAEESEIHSEEDFLNDESLKNTNCCSKLNHSNNNGCSDNGALSPSFSENSTSTTTTNINNNNNQRTKKKKLKETSPITNFDEGN